MASPFQTRRFSLPLLLALLAAVSLTACAAAPAVLGTQRTAVPQNSITATATQASQLPTPDAGTAASSVPAKDRASTATIVPSQILANGEAVSVPILLYHHVSDEQPDNRYYIGTKRFREHMEALRKEGWTAITTAALAHMLRGEAPLPVKSLVITFDDGAQDVYQNAFPVMREVGFPGVFFLVSSAIGSEGYATTGQLNEMIAAGWEMGSHSMTHADLSKAGIDLRQEMYFSAVQIETALDIPVQSLAYPFSSGSEHLYRLAPQYGYTNASCAGWNNRQSAQNLFCLSRREVKSDMSADDVLRLVSEP